MVQPLNTADDWKAAAEIYEGFDADNPPAIQGTARESDATGADGKVSFDNLEYGLYLVTETDAPDGYVKAKPFLVYVPMTVKDENNVASWQYDVHAYPKNSKVTIEKKVKDAEAHVGDDYTYTIETGIPSVNTAKNEKVSKYEVTDTFQEELALPGANNIVIKVGEADTPPADSDPALVSGTDYTIETTGRTVTVKFTKDGLEKITFDDASSKKVYTTITTKVESYVPVVANDATLIAQGGEGTSETTVESDEVKTYWGELEITKQDPTKPENQKALAGAKFKLYQCVAGETDPSTYVVDPNKPEALTIHGKNEWETAANGKITIEGIHASSFADNKADDIKYCVQESEAPAGYVKDETLHMFELKHTDATDDGQGGVTAIKAAAVVDNYKAENELPSRGALWHAG